MRRSRWRRRFRPRRTGHFRSCITRPRLERRVKILTGLSRQVRASAHLLGGAVDGRAVGASPRPTFRVYGDVAVATNRATIKEKYSGKATAGQFQSSLVFAKKPTGWQLICNQ